MYETAGKAGRQKGQPCVLSLSLSLCLAPGVGVMFERGMGCIFSPSHCLVCVVGIYRRLEASRLSGSPCVYVVTFR